jgi:hypothetical protein
MQNPGIQVRMPESDFIFLDNMKKEFPNFNPQKLFRYMITCIRQQDPEKLQELAHYTAMQYDELTKWNRNYKATIADIAWDNARYREQVSK